MIEEIIKFLDDNIDMDENGTQTLQIEFYDIEEGIREIAKKWQR